MPEKQRVGDWSPGVCARPNEPEFGGAGRGLVEKSSTVRVSGINLDLLVSNQTKHMGCSQNPQRSNPCTSLWLWGEAVLRWQFCVRFGTSSGGSMFSFSLSPVSEQQQPQQLLLLLTHYQCEREQEEREYRVRTGEYCRTGGENKYQKSGKNNRGTVTTE